MYLKLVVVAFIGCSVVPAFSQSTRDGAYQVKVFANLQAGDSIINIGNTGAGASGTSPFGVGGNLCVNVYVFSPDEQEIACCSCLVTPNAVQTMSGRQLVSRPITPSIPSAITVKLLATAAGTGAAPCDPSAPGALVPALLAFGVTLHAAPVGGSIAAGTFATTETPFTPSTLSAAELTRLTTLCGFIRANGTGFGVCPGCTVGAAGASRQ